MGKDQVVVWALNRFGLFNFRTRYVTGFFYFQTMILYNITVAVDDAIHDDWFKWMKEIHIPEVMATNKFKDCKMFKVLLNKEDATTYSIQYFTESMAELQLYQAIHAEELRTKHTEMFGESAVSFRTVLEEV